MRPSARVCRPLEVFVTTRVRHCVLFSVLVLSSISALGEKPSRLKEFESAYLHCIKPASVKCDAISDAGKQRCPQCEQWGGLITVQGDGGEATSVAAYVGRGRSARAFIHDLLVNIFRISEDRAARYTPPSLRALYDHPEAYGWVEVAVPEAGVLLMDRDVAAFTLQATPPLRGRGAMTFKRLLYHPSLFRRFFGAPAIQDGTVSFAEMPGLFARDRPIALKPDFEIEQLTPDLANKTPTAWNAWFEEPPSPNYWAVERLKPNTEYNLVLHIAPLEYRGQFLRYSSDEVQRRITSRSRTTGAHALRLTSLLLTDDEALRVQGSGTADILVDLDKVRAWTGEGPSGDALSDQRARRTDPDYLFGNASLRVRTTDKEGTTLIGVSIWDELAWPIDELTISVCVASSSERAREVCEAEKPTAVAYSSFDVGRPAVTPGPDAALHFISFGRAVTGVFHRNQRGAPYLAWKIPGGAQAFTEHLAALNNAAARARYDQAMLSRAGEELYRLLFGRIGDEVNLNAEKAQAAFEGFIRPHLLQSFSSPGRVPSLFVRYLTTEPERQLTLVPLGMAKVGPGPDAYLGFHFQIQSPLQRNGHQEGKPCLTNWHLVLPSATHPELGSLRQAFDVQLGAWSAIAQLSESMDELRDWIGVEDTDSPTALVILSHHFTDHHSGTVSFDDHDDLRASEIHRRFQGNTLAILNGCGTAESSADDFVTALNTHGIGTIIASAHTVDSAMAVDYFGCLCGELTDASADAPTVSEAHFRALQCLRDRSPRANSDPYGAAALAYVMMGNPSAELCQPQGELGTEERP